jgi:hypothetical protein
MKLFVWHGDGVLEDYTSGQIVALGNDLQEALTAVRTECGYCMDSFPNDRPTDVVDLGDCPGVQPRAWVTWGGG